MTFSCSECGFSLWHPIAELGTSFLGLYDDARFPGRSILVLKEHADSFTRLGSRQACDLTDEARVAGQAIQTATGAARMNYAVLGNAVSHVHFHLIPRFPSREANPHQSPWDDPRPKLANDPDALRGLVESIRHELLEILRRRGKG